MAIREINFDGIIGPSHNYAGLSLGNLASARHAGDVSQPRAAALQGLDKMRANLALGLVQGLFVPPPRPADGWLAALGTSIEAADAAGLRKAVGKLFGARRQCHVGIDDVGGQCRDRVAGPRHRRWQVPPDRRQFEDHAAPQP